MAVCARLLRQNVVKYNRTLSTFNALASQVKLTSERYPNLARGNFAVLEDSDLKQFESILDAGKLSSFMYIFMQQLILSFDDIVWQNCLISWANVQALKVINMQFQMRVN